MPRLLGRQLPYDVDIRQRSVVISLARVVVLAINLATDVTGVQWILGVHQGIT